MNHPARPAVRQGRHRARGIQDAGSGNGRKKRPAKVNGVAEVFEDDESAVFVQTRLTTLTTRIYGCL